VARILRPGGRFAVVWNTRDERIPWVKRLGRAMGSTGVGDQVEILQRIAVDENEVGQCAFLDDAVAAYLAIEAALVQGEGGGQAFNAGGERPHAVREVVDLIAAAAGTGIEPEYLGNGTPDGEIDRQYVDSTKLRDLTGWRPRIELADGLHQTLDWYRTHPEARPA